MIHETSADVHRSSHGGSRKVPDMFFRLRGDMNNIYESFLRPFGGKRQSRARRPFMVIRVFSIARTRARIGALSAPVALNRLTYKLLIGAPKLFLVHLIVHQMHQLRKDGKTRPKKVRRLRIFVPRRGTFLSHGDNLIKCRLIVKFSREFTQKAAPLLPPRGLL